MRGMWHRMWCNNSSLLGKFSSSKLLSPNWGFQSKGALFLPLWDASLPSLQSSASGHGFSEKKAGKKAIPKFHDSDPLTHCGGFFPVILLIMNMPVGYIYYNGRVAYRTSYLHVHEEFYKKLINTCLRNQGWKNHYKMNLIKPFCQGQSMNSIVFFCMSFL